MFSKENKIQLFIPRGFTHGFSVSSGEEIFTYDYYKYKKEIRFDETNIDIE